MRISTQSSIRCCGTRFGNSVVTILPVQNKNFSVNPQERTEVPGADKETKKSFTVTILLNLASLVKNYTGIIVRQHHTDRKQMGLLKEQCAE